jgi:hypothetical protein
MTNMMLVDLTLGSLTPNVTEPLVQVSRYHIANTVTSTLRLNNPQPLDNNSDLLT